MSVVRKVPVDVVVIGAGFGGAAFSKRLSEKTQGLHIVCLERGEWIDRATFPAWRSDWQRAILNEWATSPNLRSLARHATLSADYPIDDTQSDFKPLMWNGVGGSTITWGAHFPRFHPSDFKTRTLDGVGDDWPFTYFDLEPYYNQNDIEMGVAGLAGDPAYPPKPERPMAPHRLGRMGAVAAGAFDRLGWHWWPVDAAINSAPYDGRATCNHCGPCLIGCANRAKASVDVTYWPKALAAGVELRTGCVVQQIDIEGGRATGVRYRDADGRDVHQPSAVVVVAGNGIGTARLLLASGMSSPALGRYFMFHGAAMVRGFFKEELDGPAGPVSCALYSHEFYETDEARGFKRGVQLQVTRENALLVQASRLAQPWGPTMARELRDEFRHSMTVLVMNEDLPEAHNRVTLTSDIASDGLPGVSLAYRVSDHTRRSLDFGVARAEEMLRAAGATRTVCVNPAPMTGWHLLGSARMGDDSTTSVTDSRGRCHEVPNLVIADGSLFPTVGAVNPGSTIGALALKLADDLAQEFA